MYLANNYKLPAFLHVVTSHHTVASFYTCIFMEPSRSILSFGQLKLTIAVFSAEPEQWPKPINYISEMSPDRGPMKVRAM